MGGTGGVAELGSAPWPLTGRHEDLEAACSAIEEGCRAFVISGEAGSGKTRLAREILRTMEGYGWVVAGATATESASASPLGALAHLVPAGAMESPATLYAATSAAIAERTDGSPLLLHLDDAHLLDPSSAALLVSLAEADVVRLILTMRSGLRAPEAILALRASEFARTLELGPLDDLAIDSLLHRVLGGPLDGQAEAQLLELSRGNPLYLRELVLGALADGTLVDVAGVWRLRGALPATEVLGDRVLGRMSSLADAAREALELVAVAEPIGLGLLETMVDVDLLEDLERRGLLRVEEDQRRTEVSLAHPVYGEILRASIGRLRRRRLARQLAETVAASGARRRDDALRIARWQIDAGLSPDPEVLLAGCRLARHHHDWSTVAALGRAAFDGGTLEAAEHLVEAHFELGEFDEVQAVVEAVVPHLDELSAQIQEQVVRAEALVRFWGQADEQGAVEVLQAGADRIEAAYERSLLRYSLGSTLAWSARIEEAEAAVAPIRDADDPRVAVQAALVDELMACTCGPAGRAIELADRWFPIHLGLADLSGTNNPGNHLLTKVVALTNQGRLEESRQLAELGYGASVANRSYIGQMWFSLELGRSALLRGDAVAARRWLREQVSICRGTGHSRPVTVGLANLAIAEAHLGDAAAAAAAVAEMTAQPSVAIPLFHVDLARARAWERQVAGDPEAARRILVEGAAEAEAAGIHLIAAFARLDALRLGDVDQAAPLAAAASRVDSPIITLAARWAAAGGDASELEAVGDELEAMGALMLAAEALALAGDAWRRAGQQRVAAGVERRAEDLASRCRGAATPALAVVESVVPLTAREREIALLVADGLTSKEVAERLFLSARTVSNHLQNAYTKLGISKRAELAAALVRYGDGQRGAS
jgi:DNA-binding CsgD family transcriptional regulator